MAPARTGSAGWVTGPAVAVQPALVDQRLDAGAGERAERVGEEAVDALAGVGFGVAVMRIGSAGRVAVGWHVDVG